MPASFARILTASLVGAAAVACARATGPAAREAAFIETEYTQYAYAGTGSISGQVVLRDEAGQTRPAAGPRFEWRRLDRVAVPGRQEATLVSELLGERGRLEPAVLAARDRYEAGLVAYLDGQPQQAAERFRAAVAAQPADLAAALLAERAEALARQPPR